MRATGIIALSIPAVLLVGALAGFGPMVRAKVGREADRRHLIVHYGSARPRWLGVELSNVDVALEGVAGVRAAFPTIVVSLTNGLAVHDVEVRGGTVDVQGDPTDVVESLQKWRALSKPAAAGEAAASEQAHAPIHVAGISLHAAGGGASSFDFDLRGGTFVRDAETSFGAEAVTVTSGPATVAVGGGRIVLSSEGTLAHANAERLDIAWRPEESPKDLAPPAHPEDDDPTAGAASQVVTAPGISRGKRPASSKPAGAVAAAADAAATATAPGVAPPLVAMPDLPAFRAKLAHVATLLAARLPDKGTVDVDGFSATVLGAHPLSIGPAPLRIAHEAGAIEISFRSADGSPAASPANAATPASPPKAAGATSTPLTLHATLPIAGGDVSASLSGGPVALSILGVKEGAAGLRDVDRATVAGEGRILLDANGESLNFDGGAELHELSLQDARLASDVLRHLDIGLRARGTLNRSGVINLAEGAAQFGAAKLRAHGEVTADAEHTAAQLDFDVPMTSCEAMLTSIPTALLPTVGAAHMTGTFGATGTVAFDTRHLEDLKLAYHVDDGCRMDSVPRDLLPDRFGHPFLHRVYGPDGDMREEETGPTTPHWADLERISPFLQVAVLTTEDGQFPRHHGFNHNAIKNALIANLKARRFVRGASTITMQLAKNLFLTREKTLSRKLEEIILTDYLEQIFQKDEMMELYLNIIEFGPDVYGAEEAAQHYFGRRPDELNLVECLFLSSIMPSPIRFHKMYEHGSVSDGWLNHLHTLMRIALRAGTITPPELEEGLKEPLVFHREGDPPPPERNATTAAHFQVSPDEDPSANGWGAVE